MQNKGFETDKKFNLKGEVEFSKDAIVSKTIINKETGTVTLFAFDKGQGLSEHTAPFDAMVQIIEGEAEIIINKKSNILHEGEIIIMPANVPHAINAKEKFKMLLTMIKSL
jgi:quercetin dioxygenase-like cupin family protein